MADQETFFDTVRRRRRAQLIEDDDSENEVNQRRVRRRQESANGTTVASQGGSGTQERGPISGRLGRGEPERRRRQSAAPWRDAMLVSYGRDCMSRDFKIISAMSSSRRRHSTVQAYVGHDRVRAGR